MSTCINLRLVTSLVGIGLPLLAGDGQPSGSAAVAAKYLASPIRFEANKGQVLKGADYVSVGAHHSVYLQKNGVRMDVPGQSRPESIMLRYVKPEAALQSQGVHQIGTTSYLIGSQRDHWFLGIPSYQKIRYHQVWNGIDVVYYGNHSQLEYDVIVGAGADLGRAAFRIAGAKGLKVDANGDLLIHTLSGDIVQHRPLAYQNTSRGRQAVEAHYAVSGDRVSFVAGQYDHSVELVVDPVIAFSIPRIVSLGANNTVSSPTLQGTAVTVDSSGNSYVVGNTLPIFQVAVGDPSYTGAFVNQVSVPGSETSEQIVFGSPNGNSSATGVATDSGGSVYISGTTASANQMPFANQYQPTNAGGTDAYLVRFNLNNISAPIVYGTYLGGSGNDEGNGVVIDTAGNAYVVGQTASPNFPTTTGSPWAGATDGFVAKINTNAVGAASLVYSYVFGGSGTDAATSVARDGNGFLYIGGYTQSTNFAPNPSFGLLSSNPSGNANGFLLKTNGTVATYLTFLVGGPISAVAADGRQQAYVTGETNGSIPTNSVNQGYGTTGGAKHAFVARFDTTANSSPSLIYSSYLAGGSQETGTGIGVDSSGNATVVGSTISTNFPLAGSPLQSQLSGSQDAFVSKVNTNASGTSSLVYSSYLGGSGVDSAAGVGMTPYGNPVVTGQTASPNFPVAAGSVEDGGSDPRAFLTKFYYEAAPFGVMDTPTANQANIAGAFGITGWSLSTIAVGTVGIWREPVNGETPYTNGLVFVGDAFQTPGSRPDVASLYPTYPNNNWGWGLLVLTNELPGTGGMPLGNGTYTFHALAVDNDGYTADIGQKTCSVNNAASVLPFGTIDTPAPGATISGTSYVNFGWALTPLPSTIPINGSTITVYIDDKPIGHPVYNQPRSDIEATFPGLNNTDGAVGYMRIDTTKYANGLHQIQWSVTDNNGHVGGIGSRFFYVQN